MRNGENKTYVKKNSFNLQLTFFAVKNANFRTLKIQQAIKKIHQVSSFE